MKSKVLVHLKSQLQQELSIISLNKLSSPFFELNDGVYQSATIGDAFFDFENQYLKVRGKEKRILEIDEIKQLPFVSKQSVDAQLWKTRRRNINRFLNYLAQKKKVCNILDIGCGNGFFTHLMHAKGHQVMGIDVNLLELKQAATAFGSNEICWIYGDVLKDPLPNASFDIITFCCSFQYFENAQELLKRCINLLKPDGEIHIIDSPFYSEKNKLAAKARSRDYFLKIEVAPMANYYFHHSFAIFQNFNLTFKYKPNKFRTKILHDSPFPWLLLTKRGMVAS